MPKAFGSDTRDGAITTGWRAAFDALDTAARNMDWENPALAATFAPPELGIATHNLWLEYGAGYIAVGQDSVLRVNVVRSSTEKATVVACIDGNEIVVYSSTHEPVPGELGEAGLEGFTSDMINTPSGWKIDHSDMLQGSCPPA
jgi:hypothetical protein